MTQRLFQDQTEQAFMAQADAQYRGKLLHALERSRRTVWVVAIPPKRRIDKPYQGRFGRYGTKRFKEARERAVQDKATGKIKTRVWEFLVFVAGVTDAGGVEFKLISPWLLNLTHTQCYRTPGAIALGQDYISQPLVGNFMDWLSTELYGEAGMVNWRVVNDPNDVLGLNLNLKS